MKYITLLLFLTPSVLADQITIPHQLANNSIADALHVQSNFDALVVESNRNDQRLASLESLLQIDSKLGNVALGDGLRATEPDNTDPLSGMSNTAIGLSALQKNITGWLNVGLGTFALHLNEAGTDNSGIGAYALKSNIDGSFNTGIGSSSMSNNVSGNHNTAVGWSSLGKNLSGENNTAIGGLALFNNTIGNSNTATGKGALAGNTTGYDNIATGYLAMHMNTTGYWNTAVGTASLKNNKTGLRNTAVGWQSLFNNVGINNTAIGTDALYLHTTGEGNTVLGNKALDTNTTGQYNTAVGSNADVSLSGLENATAIGHYAIVSASNTIQLGNDRVIEVKTAGKLTAGAVTFPNVHGSNGQILGTTGSGELVWIDTNEIFAHRAQKLEDQVASLQQELRTHQEKLLTIIQSQQEQIAQLQQMVGYQFAAR